MPEAAKQAPSLARASTVVKPAAPRPAPISSTTAWPAVSQAVPPTVQLGRGATPRPGGGEPLRPGIKTALEGSFNVGLESVRVHSGPQAQSTARDLSARAFTFGSDIFLGPGERPTNLRLMAHEVSHVVQQQAAPSIQRWSNQQSDRFEHEAQQASSAALLGQSFTVHERTSAPRVQRLGLSDILDGLADLAANLPGFTLLTVIIGRNPINMRPVERNFTNLLRGFMGLILGGEILFQILNRYGVVERLGAWVSEQVASLGLTYEYLRGRFTAFTDSLSWTDIFSPGDVWRRARDIFTEPVNRIRSFISRLISQAITWLKETFLQPLSEFCRQVPGYTLVTVLLGRDPFTNAAVPRTALNVVRAFAEFIPGGTERVNQLVESRALQRAYEWFIQETQARNLTWERISGTFAQAWNSLRLEDVLQPIDTLRRIVNMFRPLMSDLIGFAGSALMKLLEFIFEGVMGAGGARVLAILKRARDTFLTIIRNPVGFLRNLLGAVGQGIRQFMRNILQHLQQGVIAWLTGPVAQAGIQMPERWDLPGIIWFVLQILGLTWARIRQKLVRLLGENVVAGLEAGFQLIQDIRQRGLVPALRDRVTEFFGQLREAALGGIRSFIQQRLVMAGITQLLSLLNPVGAIIQAIIKTYNTIQFFIQRMNQILDLVESIVNSISAIASGAIAQAANFVERTMARTIPIILDFLARFIGLGDIGGQVQRTIQSLQARVDSMLDRAVEWIRTMAARVVAAGRSAVTRLVQWWTGRVQFRTRNNQTHTVFFRGTDRAATLMVATAEMPIDVKLNHLKTTKLPSVSDANDRKRLGDLIGEGEDKLRIINDLKQRISVGQTATGIQRLLPYQINELQNQIQTNQNRIAQIHKDLFDAFEYDSSVFGPGIDTQVNEAVVTLGANARSLRVKEIKLFEPRSQRAYLKAQAPNTTTDTYLYYGDYKTKWDKPTVAPFVAAAPKGAGTIVTIDKAHLNTGRDPGTLPPNFYHGIWVRAGHLVAKQFGGGNYSDGNIVPMTITANHTSQGIRGIEIPVALDINAGAVYEYEAQPSAQTAPGALPSYIRPPRNIIVTAKRLYPTQQNPPNVPPSYTVDNTIK